MASKHLILCRPLLLPPSIFPSIRVYSNDSVLCIRWPKYGSFSFSIIPSNAYSGLISFRMGLLDLLAVQGTLKSLLQHHSSIASILWCSTFFNQSLNQSLGEWSHHRDYLGFEDIFCTVLLCILAWKIPWTTEPGRLPSMELSRVGHDWATSLSLYSLEGKLWPT